MSRDMLLYGSRDKVKTRAVIYVRVSDDRAGGKSVAEQEKHCREFVKRQGWNVVAVYSDNDKSANENSRDVREDWEKLVVELEAGRFDYIVVWEPSRATRDEIVWHQVAAACIKQGVMFVANDRLYDPADPEDRFMLDLFFALARREAAMTRKRVLRGSGDRAKNGNPGTGKAPFGYRRIYSEDTRRVSSQVPDERPRTTPALDIVTETVWTPADIVRSMFVDAVAGKSAHSIAVRLNALGIFNPRTLHAIDHHPARERKYDWRWSPHVVRHILQNPAYIGARMHHGVMVKEAAWEALVSEETFYAVQNMFATRKGSQRKRPANQRHLLSYFGLCGVCERKVQFTNQGRIDAYRCGVGHTYVRKDDAERYVEWYVMSWLAAPENLQEIRLSSRDEAEIARARAEVERLEADLAEWEADAIAGDIPRSAYKARLAVLTPQITEAKKMAFEMGLPPELHKLVELEDPSKGWADLPFDARRQILTYLFDLKLLPVGRGVKNIPVEKRVRIARKLRAEATTGDRS